ncbi:MAG: tRNA 2-thiocytidine(32) synthetase TtcA [Proteobacteria bacterium]|nr:tRNA 2-thiocytidine(32) synthetase TtcA [Desulfobacula sp.]MBU3951476.1 tRNA 2-thiocytidine(32) synthetase TtcA [Pseudomonadota bacterium]MBU4130747.1 tRNA 2-thiocytidine(32) synthetase TtcA [Pseudomonadota bacterium]
MKGGLKKRLNHAVGKAIHDWSMIADKDRILVGVSGGKDSQTLLHVLFSLQKKAPVKFDIVPVHIDPGFEGSFAKDLEIYVEENFVPLQVEYTDYGLTAHSEENRENPCFLCARLRRNRLFKLAQEQGCKKIALGHNKDDIIETLFINMFYAGKIGTMKPRQSFFGGALAIIRPLAYVEKKDIVLFSNLFGMPEFVNNCPSANQTKREEIRRMLDALYKQNKNIKGNIFRAMGNVASDYLLENKND